MATLVAKLPSPCYLIILLLLLGERVSAIRPKFPSMEQENSGRGVSTMLMANKRSEMGSGKAALLILAKGPVPPSGPSHRGHNAPRFAGYFNNRSPWYNIRELFWGISNSYDLEIYRAIPCSLFRVTFGSIFKNKKGELIGDDPI